ncbi:MAG: polysaccharide biosynthesis C-terminal domain-containing protein, partial [Bacteroidota bacterium]
GVLVVGGALLLGVMIEEPIPSLEQPYFMLSVVTAVPSLYFSLWSGLMYGTDRVRDTYKLSAITTVLTLLLYGLAVLLNGSVSTILEFSAGAIFVRAIVAIITMRSFGSIRLGVDLSLMKSTLTYGIALYVGLAVNTLHFRVDQFLVDSILGPTQLGYYALSVRIAELLWLIDYIVVSASLFRITSENRQESILTVQRAVRLVGILVVPPSIFILIGAPYVIPALFGGPFANSVSALRLLVPGIVAWSLARSLGPFIAYQCGRPWYCTIAAVGSLAINLGANLILIPRWGIEGCAVASSCSYTLNLVAITWLFKRLSGASVLKTFVPSRIDFRLIIEYFRTGTGRIIGVQ